MRSLVVVLALLAGCELKPAPKKSPAAKVSTDGSGATHGDEGTGSAAGAPPTAPAAPATGSAAPAADPAQPAGAGSAAPAPPPAPAVANPDVSAACTDLAKHITNVALASANPKAKAKLEQERDRYVRRAAETCMKANYSDQVRSCMLKATTNAALEACTGGRAPKRERPRPRSGT
ncbi:MAG: hypothetical protein AB7P03_28795 [Kofleriaceae bacterium]